MEISEASLRKNAERMAFQMPILEKVWRLMSILDEISIHPFLQDRLVLKGGTALNLFVLNVPRLSIDIDLNYIGTHDRELMLQERPQIEKALEGIFQREKLTVRRIPNKHAGGKWRLQYRSVLEEEGSLFVDLNFMFRVPLWAVEKRTSKQVGDRQTKEIPILNVHELAAGKFTALFARHAARDLFDAYHLLTKIELDPAKLRLAFVLYVGMSSMDWQAISPDHLGFDEQEFRQELLPVAPESLPGLKEPNRWANEMLHGCKQKLPLLFPFKDNEREFLRVLSDSGETLPDLLTEDSEMQAKIESHPLLNWRKFLIKKFGKKQSLPR